MLLVAFGCFALAISTFWLDRVAFSPEVNTDATFAILGDEDIRQQIASVVSGADAQQLGVSPAELKVLVVQVASIRDGATEMREFVAAAHERLLGDHDDPVIISPSEQVQITRTERAADLPPITLPVERVTTFDVLSSITSWTWLISLAIGVFSLMLGLLFRPEQGEFSFAFGTGMIASGLGLIVFGYLVPTFIFPLLSGDIWVGVFPSLATHRATLTFAAGIVFAVLGGATLLFSGGGRQRRSRSTPLATTRYREQQRWSR
jgi:hypothetical protein